MKPKDNDSGNKRLLGVIKLLNHGKGHGFIACPQILCISSSDIFISAHHIRQDFVVGQEVSFSIMYHKGKPQAHEIHARPLEERFEGTVKSFSPESRYGFIDGSQVINQFGKEVYFKANETIISGSNHSLATGTKVSFKLCLAFQNARGLADGTPQAVDVKIESAPSCPGQE
jgi:cold shock CspA family protein